MRRVTLPSGIGILLVVVLSGLSSPGSATAKTQSVPPAQAFRVDLEVSGDASVMLVDPRGRRTGWEWHFVRDIPGCRLDAIGDEIAEPTAYTFHFARAAGSYRLDVKPRTDGEVTISIRASGRAGHACDGHTSRTVSADSTCWCRVSWSVTGAACRARVSDLIDTSQVSDSK